MRNVVIIIWSEAKLITTVHCHCWNPKDTHL